MFLKHTIQILAILFFLGWCTGIQAQGLSLPFQNLSVEDGLPQNSVTALIQDDQGFIWIGTQDGLAKYDGYNFKIFRNERNNPNSLSHNFIWNISKDKKGILWITTLGNGMTRLDPKSEDFTQFLYSSDGNGLSHWNTFSTLCVDSSLYVGTNESLDKIDLNTGEVKTYYPGLELGNDSLTSLIRSIVQDPYSEKVWLSTKLGLTLFNPVTESFEYFPKSPFGKDINLRKIFTISPEGDSLIICTSTQVLSLNFKKQRSEVIFDHSWIESEKATSFHGFYRGKDQSDFVFSQNGIIEINRKEGSFRHHMYDPENPRSLAHNYVISLIQSNDGVLWVGTRNGLSAVRSHDKGFLRIGKSNNAKKSLKGKAAKGFVSLNDSVLLVGTSEGIEAVNFQSGNVIDINDMSVNKIPAESRYSLSIIEDQNNVIWSGSRGGGLTKITKDSNEMLSIENDYLNGASIQYILDGDSILWLGSSGHGLLKYSKDQGLLKSYPFTSDSSGPSHPYVYCLMQDGKNNLWLGTPTGGVNLFEKDQELFVHINEKSSTGLSGKTVLCFFEDNEEIIWVGTTTGLSKLTTTVSSGMATDILQRKLELQFEHYGREEGFPNEVIYGILEDENGFLWIGTNDGLVKFDKDKLEVVNVFKRSDGCQTDEYNQNAFLKLPNGNLVFGGVSGFQIFHPDSLSILSNSPEVQITELIANKKNYSPNDLDLDLSYNQNDLSFEFTGLSFVNTNENKYRYRLIGFDESWYERTSNRNVTYTNLDPGSYLFEVNAANCDGVWGNQAKAIAFSIATPPWFSWYAYVVYLLLGLGVIHLILKIRTDQVRKQEGRKLEIEAARIEEREHFRKRSAADFHDEAGNKITRINLLVELAKSFSKENDQLNQYLGKIARNTSELSRGMRDFNWALDPEKDTLFDLLERIKTFGESMYEGDQSHFEIKGWSEELNHYRLPMALRRDLLMIFKEAINNAVKHSRSTNALLEVLKDEKKICLKFSDFGKGLLDKADTSGYGLKNMQARAQKHKLSFKISSTVREGTSVQINLPHMGDRVH